MAPPLALLDLGRAGYEEAWRRQLELVAARQRGEIPDTLITVEHDHVITLGRRRDSRAHVLAAGDVPVVEVERGGDVTYHGPGQLVAYPIVLLREGERDLHRFLRNLEEAIIRTVAALGIEAGRREGATGVWVGDLAEPMPQAERATLERGAAERPGARPAASAERYTKKLASIGIACRKWVTFHGLALNVSTDLAYFHRINPCGFDAAVMTSLAALGAPASVRDLTLGLAAHVSYALDRQLQGAPP